MPFLDTFVTDDTECTTTKVETELDIKPMNSGIILHCKAAHPTLPSIALLEISFAEPSGTRLMGQKRGQQRQNLDVTGSEWVPRKSSEETSERSPV